MQERIDFDRCKNATLTAATTDALLRAAMLKGRVRKRSCQNTHNNQLAYPRGKTLSRVPISDSLEDFYM